MRILFIRPPYTRLRDSGQLPYFPLGIGYLASASKDLGHDVRILNLDNPSPSENLYFHKKDVFYSRKQAQERYWESVRDDSLPVWKELRDVLAAFNPEIIGISILTPEVASSVKVTKICKEMLPEVFVIWGGVHPTYEDKSSLDFAGVDVVARGEGESIFLNIVHALSEDRCWKGLPGISYKTNNEFVRNQDACLIENLDELKNPLRSELYFPERMHPLAYGSIITARGCPWRCAFCTSRDFWKGKVRFRSAKNVVSEIKEIKKKYKIKVFTFWDDTFTIKKEFVENFVEEILAQKVDIMWRTATRADVLDEQLARKLRKAGCIHLELGLESGSERMLKIIKKDIDLKMVREGLKIIRNAGIRSGVFLMTGFPEEIREDIEETRKYLSTIEPDEIVLNIFDPMPGSELFKTCRDMGLLPDPVDWEHFPLWPLKHYAPHIPEETFRIMVLELAEHIFQYNRKFSNLMHDFYMKIPMLLGDPVGTARLLRRKFRRKFLS